MNIHKFLKSLKNSRNKQRTSETKELKQVFPIKPYQSTLKSSMLWQIDMHFSTFWWTANRFYICALSLMKYLKEFF